MLKSSLKQLAERYLVAVGPIFGTVLLGTLLIWITIGLGGLLYVTGRIIVSVYTIGRAAYEGGIVEIALAVVIAIFLVLSVLLVRSTRRLWQQQQRQRWRAQRALTGLEERLFPGEARAVYLEDLRERLALRALESMEKQVLGATQSEELTHEERIVELETRTTGRAPAGAPNQTDEARDKR